MRAPQLFSLAGQNVLVTGASRGTSQCHPVRSPPPLYPLLLLAECGATRVALGACLGLFSSVLHLASLLVSPLHVASTPADQHTHAPTGIGQACAIALAEAGADVCLVLRPSSTTTSSSTPTTQERITALGRRAHVLECDLSDLEAVKGLFDRAVDAMGGEVHVLVNCGGIQRRAPAVAFSEEDWDEVCLFVCLLFLFLFLFLFFLSFFSFSFVFFLFSFSLNISMGQTGDAARTTRPARRRVRERGSSPSGPCDARRSFVWRGVL